MLRKKLFVVSLSLICLLLIQTSSVFACGSINTMVKVLENGVVYDLVHQQYEDGQDTFKVTAKFYNKNGKYVGKETKKQKVKVNEHFNYTFTNDKAKYGKVEISSYMNGKPVEQSVYNIRDFYQEEEEEEEIIIILD